MLRSDLPQSRPTLLSSCARATTAAEARFRISRPDTYVRDARVIAVDDQAAVLVRAAATERSWRGGHFLVFDRGAADGGQADAVLRAPDGAVTLLSEELDGADLVVMIATAAARREAVSLIGDACAERMIMSAGLVVGDEGLVGPVVAALRPNAMVLGILGNAGDVPEILTALRV
jgi:predicted dinucleotide-utilizing enzyme